MASDGRGILLVPVLFALIFVGLFFAVTDPNSWPTRRTVLSATDMSLAPSVSTVWCESLVLNSPHDLVAYKVDNVPRVTSKLSKNAFDVETKFSHKRHQHLQIKYFLLSGSVLNVFACASSSYAYLRVYQGQLSEDCACTVRRTRDSSEPDSDESDDESDENDNDEGNQSEEKNNACMNPLKIEKLPVSYEDDCRGITPVSINVTKPDYYAILFTSSSPSLNRVKIKLTLDRTTYNISKSQESVYNCGDGSTCVIPLTFGSRERVVLWIPSEPDAGRNFFVVESRCYPRIALFAVLTFALPSILFTGLAYVVFKSPRLGRNAKNRAITRAIENSSPLLTRRSHQEGTAHQNDVRRDCSVEMSEALTASIVANRPESGPPSYEGLYEDPPPSYSSLEAEGAKLHE